MGDGGTAKGLSTDRLAPYVRDGRLLSYPRKWERRTEILRWLIERIERNRTYAESEINALLGSHAIDHVTLRRYLVDAGLLQREGGRYWRSED